MAAEARAVPLERWLDRPPDAALVEVVRGELVVKLVGGNPHHYLARRLAEEFERQWPGTVATAPGNWALELTHDGRVVTGRMPDVLVDGAALLTAPVFTGVPDAVVEVWSPGNGAAARWEKRLEYRRAGLPALLEAYLADDGEVHLDWLVPDREHGASWLSLATASGSRSLVVPAPRPFEVRPDDLLRMP